MHLENDTSDITAPTIHSHLVISARYCVKDTGAGADIRIQVVIVAGD